MNAGNFVKLVKFIDGVYIGSSSKIDIFGQSCSNHFVSSCAHDLFKASINNIFLLGSLQKQRSVEFLLGKVGSLLYDIQEVLLGLFLPFPLHTTWSDVVEILEPFKVADSHTSSIA